MAKDRQTPKPPLPLKVKTCIATRITQEYNDQLEYTNAMNDIYASNDNLRKRLTKDWDSLSYEQQVLLRSYRAKRGVKCDICGFVGFYRENCPKNCSRVVDRALHEEMDYLSSKDKVETKASTSTFTKSENESVQSSPHPVVGLWNAPSPPRVTASGQEIDLRTLVSFEDESETNEEPRKETSSLHIPAGGLFHDKAVKDFQKKRTMAELTLHQVLLRLVRVLESEISANQLRLQSTVKSGLLVPPARAKGKGIVAHGENYAPERITKMRAYRDYFAGEKERKDRSLQAHQYRGSYQTDDLLSGFLRGDVPVSAFYRPNPQAGKSVHSKTGWKDITNRHDHLAESDKQIVQRMESVERVLEAQSQWITQHKLQMQQENQRIEHLLHIINTEISSESQREMRLLSCPEHQANKAASEVWADRLNTASRLVKTLLLYEVVGRSEEGAYLLFTLEQWGKTRAGRAQARTKARGKLKPKPKAGKPTAERGKATENNAGRLLGEGVGEPKSSIMKLEPTLSTTIDSRDTSAILSSLGRQSQSSEREEYGKPHPLRDEDSVKGLLSLGSSDVDRDRERGWRRSPKQSPKSRGQRKTSKEEFPALLLDIPRSPKERAGLPGGLLRFSPVQRLADGAIVVSRNTSPVSSRPMSPVSPSLNNGSLSPFLLSPKSQSPINGSAAAAAGRSPEKKTKASSSTIPPTPSDLDARKPRGAISRGRKTMKKTLSLAQLDRLQKDSSESGFRHAALEDYIRAGRIADPSNTQPALIPIYKSFTDAIPTASHFGDTLSRQLNSRQTDPVTGHKAVHIAPLFVSNTTIDSRGQSVTGSRSYGELSKDRRYSHFVGRILSTMEG